MIEFATDCKYFVKSNICKNSHLFNNVFLINIDKNRIGAKLLTKLVERSCVLVVDLIHVYELKYDWSRVPGIIAS